MAFPDLKIPAIKAKVDTGARTSALHAFDLTEIQRDGVAFARFEVHPQQRRSDPSILVELPIIGWRRVRDSGGHSQNRPVVETTIALLDEAWKIEMTLTRRDVMGFRMLLGRQAIRNRFLVDAGRSYYGGRSVESPRSGQPTTKDH